MGNLLHLLVGFSLKDYWFKLGKKRPPFYNRFVNESNLQKIDDPSIQSEFWTKSSFVIIFSIASAIFPTMGGFMFTYESLLIMFFELISFICMITASIDFVHLDEKYHVFRNKNYAFIFCSIYCLLTFAFIIEGYLTTKVELRMELDYFVWNFTLWPLLLIYLPLLIIYIIFCYYAFNRCFIKYDNNGIASRKKETQGNSNNTSQENL